MKFTLKVRSIHGVHLPGSSESVWPSIVMAAFFAARFHWTVKGMRTSWTACSSASFARSLSLSAGPFRRIASICCRTIGLGGPSSSLVAVSPSNTRRLRMPPISVLPSS